ncbi:MAG: ATP-binding domain-containing protein, partial [Burkholderiales bacterium]|nr:ATP-binding domain-containing protein [Burkholderiales bacterium]
MQLNDGSKREYSAEELAVLGGVIDYADRMIYEDQHLNVLGGMADPRGYVRTTQAPLYRLLRKNAYAKTVVIETELKGRVILRLSPTEVIYPNFSSGYCTPHSPQGRLASFVQPGYEHRSKLWGDYKVVEVRSFERFGGADFEPNVRNFLRMGVTGEAGDGTVADLKGFLRRVHRVGAESAEPPVREMRPEVEAKLVTPEPVIPAVVPPPQVTVVEFEVVEEPEDREPELVDESEEEWDRDSPPVKADDYYGLSERFFTHQTEEQNQVISRSPLGPMFVEGVAGSGKTSAALGRTKMLTTFNAASVVDEQTFRDLLGPGQDYWSAEFAGQFSQEASVGFVRTGELIQYLQETCRRIDLPDLPVQEFKELQARLRDHRKLTRSLVPGRRWSGATDKVEAHEATTMAWLHATEQAIARRQAEQLLQTLPTVAEIEEAFEPEDRSKVARVISPALSLLGELLSEVSVALRDPPRDGAFALDRLALRLSNVISEVRRRVTGPRLIWTHVGSATFHAADENNLARQLVGAKAALYLRTGQRLVFVDDNGPTDASLQLLGLGGEPLAWGADTKGLLDAGQVVVRDVSGKNYRGLASDINHLFLRLLPEATDRIYTTVGDRLRPLSREQGWGRAKLRMLPAAPAVADDDEPEEEAEGTAEPATPGQPRSATPDAVFARMVKKRLFASLTALPDLYLDALRSGSKHFPFPALAQEVQTRLEQFKLADQDIDLLLCVAHLVGRGLKQGGLPSLREPTFYQAVFIDEVQDFTEQQVYLMVEQSNPRYRAITVVGDFAQKLHHGTTIDLRACFPAQSLPIVRLSENLRQSNAPGLALFSALFRTHFFGDPAPSDDLRAKALAAGRNLERPNFVVLPQRADQDWAIVQTLRSTRRSQTVAVLFPNSHLAAATFKRVEPQLRALLIDAELSETVNLARRHVRHFADVANAKGLEFDVVIVAGADEFNLDQASQVNRLYVGVTRARCALTLLTGHAGRESQLSQ